MLFQGYIALMSYEPLFKRLCWQWGWKFASHLSSHRLICVSFASHETHKCAEYLRFIFQTKSTGFELFSTKRNEFIKQRLAIPYFLFPTLDGRDERRGSTWSAPFWEKEFLNPLYPPCQGETHTRLSQKPAVRRCQFYIRQRRGTRQRKLNAGKCGRPKKMGICL